MKKYVVTGTDTGVGKTWITSMLLKRAGSSPASVGVYKPACSGAEYQPDGSARWEDVELLYSAADNRFPRDLICPQRFLAPLAPPESAREESTTVDSGLLRSGALAFTDHCETLLIEGAGGLMCPLSDDTTVLDLAVELNADVIVVAANRLGVLNHTLLTVAAARTAGCTVSAVILNETEPPDSAASDVSRTSNAGLLQQWIPDLTLLHSRYGSHGLSVLTDHGLADIIQPAVL